MRIFFCCVMMMASMPSFGMDIDIVVNGQLEEMKSVSRYRGKERAKKFIAEVEKYPNIKRVRAMHKGYYILAEYEGGTAKYFCDSNGYKDWAGYMSIDTRYDRFGKEAISLQTGKICKDCKHIQAVWCVEHSSQEDKYRDILLAVQSSSVEKALALAPQLEKGDIPEDSDILVTAMRIHKPGVIKLQKELLEKGASVHAKGRVRENTPLHQIMTFKKGQERRWEETRHAHMVNVLLEHGADVNATNRLGETPLIVAMDSEWPKTKKGGNYGIILAQELLSRGAEINIVSTSLWSSTPLMAACANNDVDLIAYLLQEGADPNLGTKNGKVPLHVLIYKSGRENVYESVKTLLKGGADPKIPIDNEKTNIAFLVDNYENVRVENRGLLKLLAKYGDKPTKEIKEILRSKQQQKKIDNIQEELRKAYPEE